MKHLQQSFSKIVFTISCTFVQCAAAYPILDDIYPDDPRWAEALEVDLDGDGSLLRSGGGKACTQLDGSGRAWLKVRLPEPRGLERSGLNSTGSVSTDSEESYGASEIGFYYGHDDLYLVTPSMVNGHRRQQSTTHKQFETVYRVIETSGMPHQELCFERKNAVTVVPSWFEVSGLYASKLFTLWLAGSLTQGQLNNFKEGLFSESITHYGMLGAHTSFASDMTQLLEHNLSLSPQVSSCMVALGYGMGYLTYLNEINGINPENLNFINDLGFFWNGALAGTSLECLDINIVTPYLSEMISRSSDSVQSDQSKLLSELMKGPMLIASLATTEGYFNSQKLSNLMIKLRLKSSVNTKQFINKYIRKEITASRTLQFFMDLVGLVALEGVAEAVQGTSSQILLAEYTRQIGAEQLAQQVAATPGGSWLDTTHNLLTGVLFYKALEGVISLERRSKLIPALAGIVGPYAPSSVNQLARTVWDGAGLAAGALNNLGGHLYSFVPSIPFLHARTGYNSLTGIVKGGSIFAGVAGINYLGNTAYRPAIAKLNRYIYEHTTEAGYARMPFQSGKAITLHYTLSKK